jgi:rubrerythrin
VPPTGQSGNAVLSVMDSRTEENKRCALSGAIELRRRYVAYARTAETDGYRGSAARLRARADTAASHADGHLEHLLAHSDTAWSQSCATTMDGLLSAAAAVTEPHAAMCAGMARPAHQEGFDDIAGWFETLAEAGRSHARRLQRALDTPRHYGGVFD